MHDGANAVALIGPPFALVWGGANRRSPSGGSAYGTPRNCRTRGAVWLMKPCTSPLVVWTTRPLLSLGLPDSTTPKEVSSTAMEVDHIVEVKAMDSKRPIRGGKFVQTRGSASRTALLMNALPPQSFQMNLPLRKRTIEASDNTMPIAGGRPLGKPSSAKHKASLWRHLGFRQNLQSSSGVNGIGGPPFEG